LVYEFPVVDPEPEPEPEPEVEPPEPEPEPELPEPEPDPRFALVGALVAECAPKNAVPLQ
jgi:hypothetical protein